MQASLDIIIVNWNSGEQLSDCIQSIVSTAKDNIILRRVVVVDNASRDGSADKRRLATFDLPLTIIQNGKNCGFAVACNQGAEGSKSDFLLFLNPDTRLLENSLVKPITFMQKPEFQSIGIMGIQLINAKGEISRTCVRFPTCSRFFSKMLGLDRLFPSKFLGYFMNEWDHCDNRIVDQVMGAFFLVRRSLFDNIGRFDERFFLYFEELDFSLRAYQAGWRSFYLAEARSYHRGGGTSEQVRARRLFYSLRSRIIYGYKHFGFFESTLLMLGTILFEPFARFLFAIVHRSPSQFKETLQGYILLWLNLLAGLKHT